MEIRVFLDVYRGCAFLSRETVVQAFSMHVKVHTYKLNWHISLFLKHHNIGLRTIKPSLKAVFQLHVFYTYVHARESLNHFNITFEVNKCFDGENSAFPTI